jgi:hypothetical protein
MIKLSYFNCSEVCFLWSLEFELSIFYFSLSDRGHPRIILLDN